MRAHLATFSMWSVAGLLANGLDIAVVGALDYSKVGAYGAALSVATILGGVFTAVIGAFLPDSAGSSQEVRRIMLSASIRFAGIYAWLSLGLTCAFGESVLTVLFGKSLAVTAYPLLVVLVLARAISQLIWPYVVGVLAAGAHRRVRATPIAEGALNFGVSVGLAISVGAVGVAIGSVIASTGAVLMHLFINVPRTVDVNFDRGSWLRVGVLRAAVPASPLFLILVARWVWSSEIAASIGISLVAVSLGLAGRELVSIYRFVGGSSRDQPD
jgi:hypothetical protein